MPAVPSFPRVARAAGVAAAATVAMGLLGLAGSAIPDAVLVHATAFWAVTCGAYMLLPHVRRGDVLMGGMWLVLAAGVAPCALGQEISAPRMFADMAGVVMAAAPVYIARLRQLAQGDLRETPRRRQNESEAAEPQYSSR